MWDRIEEKAKIGWTGWDSPHLLDTIDQRIQSCIQEGNEVDAANLLMFKWNIKQVR